MESQGGFAGATSGLTQPTSLATISNSLYQSLVTALTSSLGAVFRAIVNNQPVRVHIDQIIFMVHPNTRRKLRHLNDNDIELRAQYTVLDGAEAVAARLSSGGESIATQVTNAV